MHEKLQDYNFKILHIPRKNNTPVDTLFRPSDNEQEVGEQQLSLLPQEAFLNLAEASPLDLLETLIGNTQHQYRSWLKVRQECLGLKKDQGQWLDANKKVVILPDQTLQR